MKPIPALLTLILIFAFPFGGTSCRCSSAPDEVTRWGGNHWIAYKQPGTYKTVSGKVVTSISDKAIEDALVEVFDNPAYLLCEWKENNRDKCTMTPAAQQRRVAACATGKDGRFCFRNIPAGEYELRVSKDGSWNVIHAYIVVDLNRRTHSNSGIVVEMSLGD